MGDSKIQVIKSLDNRIHFRARPSSEIPSFVLRIDDIKVISEFVGGTKLVVLNWWSNRSCSWRSRNFSDHFRIYLWVSSNSDAGTSGIRTDFTWVSLLTGHIV